jgi:cytochrome c oxidase subunit 2
MRRTAAPIALVAGAIVLGGCQVPTFGAFRGATVQGHDEFKLWVGMSIAGLAVAALVWALIFWTIIRYRRRNNPGIPTQFHANIPLEIFYTVVPLIMVFVIFAFTVIVENQVDAVSANPSEIVHVQGYRWGWNFSYYSGKASYQGVEISTKAEPKLLAQPATSSEYPQLVLPVGETVRVVLTSLDVIHGFYIPEFNFSRYAQPGVTNRFDFTPTQTGIYRGQCSEYCGLYHSEMLFSVRVVSQRAFAHWLSSQQTSQA